VQQGGQHRCRRAVGDHQPSAFDKGPHPRLAYHHDVRAGGGAFVGGAAKLNHGLERPAAEHGVQHGPHARPVEDTAQVHVNDRLADPVQPIARLRHLRRVRVRLPGARPGVPHARRQHRLRAFKRRVAAQDVRIARQREPGRRGA